MLRRNCLKGFFAFISATILFPGKIFAKKMALGLDKVVKLKEVGGFIVLKIAGRELLFIRSSEEDVKVLDSVCTHKHCTVAYDPEKKLVVCPCHGSTFSLEGEVLEGPADKPLESFEATLDEDRIIFTIE